MAKQDQLHIKNIRYNRYFSESFKKKKVKEIEQNLTLVLEASRAHAVSTSAVYKWLYKFSTMKQKGLKQVVEPLSDTRKIQALKKQINQLGASLGRKQIQFEFSQKMIEPAEDHYNIDIKKRLVRDRPLVLRAQKQTSLEHESTLQSHRNRQAERAPALESLFALEEEKALLLPLLLNIRENHPAMGAKVLYQKLSPKKANSI